MAPPKKPNNSFNEDALGLTYIYPKSEAINIHKSDLQIQLTKYKEKILASFSLFDLLAILSLWSPVVTAEFKSVLGLAPNEMQAGYIVLAFCLSFAIIYSRVKYYFKKPRPAASASPEDMANNILNQCQAKSNGQE
jgi:hypothetical protein